MSRSLIYVNARAVAFSKAGLWPSTGRAGQGRPSQWSNLSGKENNMLRYALVGLSAVVLVGATFVPDDALAYRGGGVRAGGVRVAGVRGGAVGGRGVAYRGAAYRGAAYRGAAYRGVGYRGGY